jgi:hypothetical protein
VWYTWDPADISPSPWIIRKKIEKGNIPNINTKNENDKRNTILSLYKVSGFGPTSCSFFKN